MQACHYQIQSLNLVLIYISRIYPPFLSLSPALNLLLCVHTHSVTLVVSDSLQPYGLEPSKLLCPWDSPGKHTGVGCHALLRGFLLTQGLNPHPLCLLHCMWLLYHWATGEATLAASFSWILTKTTLAHPRIHYIYYKVHEIYLAHPLFMFMAITNISYFPQRRFLLPIPPSVIISGHFNIHGYLSNCLGSQILLSPGSLLSPFQV